MVFFFFFPCPSNSNYPQVKYVHPELGLFLEAWERMRGLLKSALVSKLLRPPRSGNEKCNFSLPAVRLNP